MIFKGERFVPSGIGEYALLVLTIFSAAAQIGLNVVVSVIVGTEFRSRTPWAFLMVVSLACAWAAGLLHFSVSYIRLVRFTNKHQSVLKRSGSALVLPLGAESLAAALGSAFLSGAVVWIAKTAGESSTGGASNAERFGQLDIYLPIATGFQILALPNFVRLADIFLYAHSKAKHDVKTTNAKAKGGQKKWREGLTVAAASTSSNGSRSPIFSAESLRAAHRELQRAKTLFEAKEKALQTSPTVSEPSTTPSAQSLEDSAQGAGTPPDSPDYAHDGFETVPLNNQSYHPSGNPHVVSLVEYCERQDRRAAARREKEMWRRDAESFGKENGSGRPDDKQVREASAERRQRQSAGAVASIAAPPGVHKSPDVRIEVATSLNEWFR